MAKINHPPIKGEPIEDSWQLEVSLGVNDLDNRVAVLEEGGGGSGSGGGITAAEARDAVAFSASQTGNTVSISGRGSDDVVDTIMFTIPVVTQTVIFVTTGADLPADVATGQIIRIGSEAVNIPPPVVSQLEYGPQPGYAGPPSEGDSILFATYASAGTSTTGNADVYSDQTGQSPSRYNLQINFPDDTDGTQPTGDTGRYSVALEGSSPFSINGAGVHLFYREDSTEGWGYVGATLDSSSNNAEGRIRIDPTTTSLTVMDDIRAGDEVGYSTTAPTTLTADTTYAWDGSAWVAI